MSELDKTIQKSLKEMKDTISKVENDMHKLTLSQGFDPSIPQLVQDLKQDLANLKGLLLSRYVCSASQFFYSKEIIIIFYASEC